MKTFLLLYLCIYANLFAQSSSYPFVTPPPPPVQSVSTNIVGNQGNQIYFYFVVARYPIGQGQPSQGTIVRNAPVTLSLTNFVLITWVPPQGATGFDLLRLSVPDFPGTCTSCLIASNTSNTSVSDVSNATLGNYTISTASGAAAIEYLDNLTGSIPTIRLDGINSQLIGFAPGSTVNVDFGGANNTKPVKIVASVPNGTCVVGSFVFVTSATAGSNIYVCPTGASYIQVNSGGGVKSCTQTFSATITLDFTSCDIIAVTVTANITSVAFTGASITHAYGEVAWINTGAFTVTGFSGTMIGWCGATPTNAVTTVQPFFYDGTNLNGQACSTVNGSTIVMPATVCSGTAGTGTGILCFNSTTKLFNSIDDAGVLTSLGASNPKEVKSQINGTATCPATYATPIDSFTIPASVALTTGDTVEVIATYIRTGTNGAIDYDVSFDGNSISDRTNFGPPVTTGATNNQFHTLRSTLTLTATTAFTAVVQWTNGTPAVSSVSTPVVTNVYRTGLAAFSATPALAFLSNGCGGADTVRMLRYEIIIHKAT